jgi:hypothetical protein
MQANNNQIVGIHFLGPNAGEVIQGYSLAIKCGATKSLLDSVVRSSIVSFLAFLWRVLLKLTHNITSPINAQVGIHPTTAEELVTLKVTKASGEGSAKSSC